MDDGRGASSEERGTRFKCCYSEGRLDCKDSQRDCAVCLAIGLLFFLTTVETITELFCAFAGQNVRQHGAFPYLL